MTTSPLSSTSCVVADPFDEPRGRQARQGVRAHRAGEASRPRNSMPRTNQRARNRHRAGKPVTDRLRREPRGPAGGLEKGNPSCRESAIGTRRVRAAGSMGSARRADARPEWVVTTAVVEPIDSLHAMATGDDHGSCAKLAKIASASAPARSASSQYALPARQQASWRFGVTTARQAEIGASRVPRRRPPEPPARGSGP